MCSSTSNIHIKSYIHSLFRFTNRIIGAPLNLQSYRHVAIAFMFNLLMHFTPVNEADEERDVYDLPQENQRASSSLLLDRQPGHSEATAGKVYAFSSMDFSYMGKDDMLNFFFCSLEWHTLLSKHNFLNILFLSLIVFLLPSNLEITTSEMDKVAFQQRKPRRINMENVVHSVETVPETVASLTTVSLVDLGTYFALTLH